VQFNCVKQCTKNWSDFVCVCVCVWMNVCMCMCLCVCVCVCVRARARVWDSLSELRSSLRERRERTVLRPRPLPVKTAQFTKFFRQVAQWLSCCATNRKVVGSIPAGVIGFFIDIKSFRSHYGPGVESASKRNEYQEYFLGVKVAGAQGWQPTTILCRCHEIWEP